MIVCVVTPAINDALIRHRDGVVFATFKLYYYLFWRWIFIISIPLDDCHISLFIFFEFCLTKRNWKRHDVFNELFKVVLKLDLSWDSSIILTLESSGIFAVFFLFSVDVFGSCLVFGGSNRIIKLNAGVESCGRLVLR